MSYYYAPAYTDPKTEFVQPGEVNEEGETVEPTQSYAPGTKSLLYDETVPHFVLRSSVGLNGWTLKESEEIAVDYPDLSLGGE